jgi:hypothetical protein
MSKFPTTYLVHRTLIPAGETVQIVTRPQIHTLRPRALRVDPSLAPARYFVIRDVQVGCKSQFVASGTDLPALRFAREAEQDGVDLYCEPILTAMDFTMAVTNTSKWPLEFCATWTCDILPEGFVAARSGYTMSVEEFAALQAEEKQLAAEDRAREAKHRTKLCEVPRGKEIEIEQLRTALRGAGKLHAESLERERKLEVELASYKSAETLSTKEPLSAAKRATLKEGWPSAVESARGREGPVDRWSRGAPCTWDPYVDD